MSNRFSKLFSRWQRPSHERAEALLAEGRKADAAALFKQLAEGGDTQAKLRLGQLYERGDGALQNFVEAVGCFRAAAEQGSVSAMARLGNISVTAALLKMAKAAWLDATPRKAHRFHRVSTAAIYGSLEPDDKPFHEATPYASNSPYSAKGIFGSRDAGLSQDLRAQHHGHELLEQLRAVSIPREAHSAKPHHILHGKPLPLYGDGLITLGKAGEAYSVSGNIDYS